MKGLDMVSVVTARRAKKVKSKGTGFADGVELSPTVSLGKPFC